MEVPKLRFKADDGSDFPNWEEKTLGELCEPLTYGMNAAATKFDGENRYIRITDIDDETHAFLSNDVVSPSGELDDKYLVKKGDILLARTGASTGKSYLYHPKDGKLFYAGFLIKAHVLPSSDDYFIYSQTLTDRYGKWVKTTSMRSGQPGINANEYASYSFSVPSLPEQRKIADLLSAVDDVIAAQEAEVAAWEKRKKGVMQKLFSQEVRFKADDGSEFPEWEEKTLGDLGRLRNGYAFKSDTYVPHGKYRVITIANVQGERYVTELERANTVNQIPDNIASWQILKESDILISLTGNIGRVSLNTGCDNLLNQRVGLFEVFSPISDRQWVFQRLSANDFRNAMEGEGQGAAQKNISRGDVESFPLSVPSLPEQRKIADCLTSLDDVIAKAKDELDAWRELKKGLLQQMFV